MAECARVRNVERLCRGGGDEAESMGMHFHASERLFDQRHVAGDALAAGAIQLVMRVGGYAVREWAEQTLSGWTERSPWRMGN